jgi:hypothetical protein
MRLRTYVSHNSLENLQKSVTEWYCGTEVIFRERTGKTPGCRAPCWDVIRKEDGKVLSKMRVEKRDGRYLFGYVKGEE